MRESNGQSRQRKSRRQRPKKQTVLIVCEGKETERNYFNSLKGHPQIKSNCVITVKRGKGGSHDKIAHHAATQTNVSGEEFDKVWCVMDVEGPAHANSLDVAFSKLRKKRIHACLSNPAFEVWLLAHFERKASSFRDCKAVIVKLNSHWQNEFKTDYQKNDRKLFDRLRDRLETAIENARWVREQHHSLDDCTSNCNSSTDVYRLVEWLLKPE